MERVAGAGATYGYREGDGEMAGPPEKAQRYKYVSRMVKRGKAVETAKRGIVFERERQTSTRLGRFESGAKLGADEKRAVTLGA
jgi:hypothetical protein